MDIQLSGVYEVQTSGQLQQILVTFDICFFVFHHLSQSSQERDKIREKGIIRSILDCTCVLPLPIPQKDKGIQKYTKKVKTSSRDSFILVKIKPCKIEKGISFQFLNTIIFSQFDFLRFLVIQCSTFQVTNWKDPCSGSWLSCI